MLVHHWGPYPVQFPPQTTDVYAEIFAQLMTHKYRGCIVVLSINKSVEPNEEQKVLMSSFD
jgi:hypothetical protein